MKQRFESGREMRLVGLRCVHTIAESQQAIPTQWEAFMSTQPIADRVGPTTYGVTVRMDMAGQTIDYMCAAEVQDFPDEGELDTLTIPKADYAVFAFHTADTSFPQAWQAIFSEWLPHARYKMAERPAFEVYGPDYKSGEPSPFEIWLPIVE